jgi:hypothetical protein
VILFEKENLYIVTIAELRCKMIEEDIVKSAIN